MHGFKDSTKTLQGHNHPWGGQSIGTPPQVAPNAGGNVLHGNAAVVRGNPPTQELAEHGGRTPLTAGFKQGGSAKHFHVHKHYHTGGKVKTRSKSYRAAEKAAEMAASAPSSVHNDTEPPAGGPDYRKGGKVHKNAGGALYATGGTVNRLAGGGMPMAGAGAAAPPGRLAMRPQGLPNRAGPALRKPMPMPGPQPVMRAKGGSMRQVAKEVIKEHVNYPAPKGHKGLGAALKKR